MTDRTPLVLIADDDPDAMELVTWYLADQGYEMIQARDGEQALAMARERLPDLILLDICMPVIDGFSVLEQLRQDPITQSIVVIIMTAAFGRRRDRLRGFALGADDYIIKPLDRRELTARIRSRLRGKLLEHEFRRHREEMEDLYRVTQGIATTLDPAQLAKELLAAAGKVIGAEDGWIILTNERNEPLHAVRYGQSLSPRAASHLARQSLTRGIGGVVSRTQTGLLIPDSAADKRYGTGELGLTGVRSVVSVPLIGRRHSRGVLTYAHSEPNRFTENHLRWLRTVAGQAAVALDNAFLYSGEQRRAVKFRLLNTVTQDISSVLEAERLLEVVANLVRRAFNHYYVGLGLLEQGGEIVIRAAALDDQDADLSSLLGSRCSEGVETWVAEHGRPLLLNDVRGDSRYRERACLAETRSELALPIHSQDGLIGVLDIRSRSLMAFDPGDVVMLETLAAQISIAIQNARLFRALRNERERLDAILNSVASPVLVTDEERRLLLANAAARQLLEIEPESIGAVIGPGVVPDALFSPLTRAIPAGEVLTGAYQTGDGRSFQVVAAPVVIDTSRAGRAVLLNEVTRLEELNRLRDEFVATVSQELGDPVEAIQEVGSLLAQQGLEEDDRVMLANRLQASADRMNTLIARLQDQSDLQRGVGLELALVDAVPLMREATRELEARVQQLDLTLTLNTPAELPVHADALRLRQVFSRLLSSAVGRAEAGGAVVIEGAAAGDHVLFRIHDSGPSIPQANQRLAPGELFPVNAGDTKPAAGVGLALVRAIVEGHQGRIWLESTPGKGSAFCFTVPLGELRAGS